MFPVHSFHQGLCDFFVKDIIYILKYYISGSTEAAITGVLSEKVLLEISQVFSCKFCEISKNTFFYRTPLGNYF